MLLFWQNRRQHQSHLHIKLENTANLWSCGLINIVSAFFSALRLHKSTLYICRRHFWPNSDQLNKKKKVAR